MIVIYATTVIVLLSLSLANSISETGEKPPIKDTTMSPPIMVNPTIEELKKQAPKNKTKSYEIDMISKNASTLITNKRTTETTATTTSISTTLSTRNDSHTTEKVPELIPPAGVEPDIHYIRRAESDM